jgi:type I restriction enzyme M protein
MSVFEQWRKTHEPILGQLKEGVSQKQVIQSLSEDLLSKFSNLPLLDKYDVYQRVMEYWANIMQDDVDLIAREGWINAAKPRSIIEDKEKKLKEQPDLQVAKKKYKMDLIPPALIVTEFFETDRKAIAKLEPKREAAGRELQEFVDENVGEEGLLEEATDENGKATRKIVKERLETITKTGTDPNERQALVKCLRLIEAELEIVKKIKSKQAILDSRILASYQNLTESEVKDIVVVDKWFTAIETAIRGEVGRLIQQLANRVDELDERYRVSLPNIAKQVETLTGKVEQHLRQMGLVWT